MSSPTPESIISQLRQGLHLDNLYAVTAASKALAESSLDHATAATFLRLACDALSRHVEFHQPISVEDSEKVRDSFVPAAEAMLARPTLENFERFAEVTAWALENDRYATESDSR